MIITQQKELRDFCRTLKNVEFITVDTEFLREKTYYPKLCLIQVSGPDKEAAAIDPLADDIDLAPLYELLFDDSLLKIFHAGRQDMEIFFNLNGKIVYPLFDTQIAAMVCGYGDQVGYETLVREIAKVQMDKSSQYTDWSRRPLSQKQLDYALGDVTHLCDIYLKLRAELDKRGRTEWVFQEEDILLDPATYEMPLEDMWKRIKIRSPKPKTLAVLRELAAWREEKAQKRNIPRGWVMRDEILAEMAAQAPQSVKDLKKIRNLSDDMAESGTGEHLITVIKKGLASPQNSWPSVKKRKPPTPEISAKIDILKMLLKIQAATNDVAPKLIISNSDLERLATEDKPDITALKGWRYEVFGREAIALKNGETAIGLKNSRIEKFSVSGKN